MSLREYQIYCYNESNWIAAWLSSPPTVCPNNSSHSVNLNSVIEISSSNINLVQSSSSNPLYNINLVGNQSSNQKLELPNEGDDILIGKKTTDTFKNKTILKENNNIIDATSIDNINLNLQGISNNQILKYNNSEINGVSPFNYGLTSSFFDDFIDTLFNWLITDDTGNNVNIISGSNGILQLKTEDTTGNNTEIYGVNKIINVSNNLKIYFRVNLLSNMGLIFKIGCKDDNDDNQISFHYNNNNTEWKCYSKKNSVETINNSGVNVSTNTWYNLSIHISSTEIIFLIDNNTTMITSNIPVENMKLFIYIETTTNGLKNCLIDYVGFTSNRDNPRSEIDFKIP